jgi:hypothetical protein
LKKSGTNGTLAGDLVGRGDFVADGDEAAFRPQDRVRRILDRVGAGEILQALTVGQYRIGGAACPVIRQRPSGLLDVGHG